MLVLGRTEMERLAVDQEAQFIPGGGAGGEARYEREEKRQKGAL